MFVLDSDDNFTQEVAHCYSSSLHFDNPLSGSIFAPGFYDKTVREVIASFFAPDQLLFASSSPNSLDTILPGFTFASSSYDTLVQGISDPLSNARSRSTFMF